MSFLDLDTLPDHRLIAQYVIEHRGQGLFLGYEDYELINSWLTAAGSADSLLVILSDVLPRFFESRRDRRHPPSLKGVDRRVIKRISETRLRAVDS